MKSVKWFWQTVHILSERLRRLLGVVIPKHFPGKQQKVVDTPHPCTFTFTLSQSSLKQSLDNIINHKRRTLHVQYSD